MSAGSSKDGRRRRLAAELEEGECAPGYHSSSDTEDYYNRDAVSWGETDETISDLDATASSAAAANHNQKGNASASSAKANLNGGARPSFAAATHHGRARAFSTAVDHYGRPRASSAATAAPMIACRVCGKKFGSQKAVCGHMKVHAMEAMHGGKDQGDAKDKKVKKRNVEVVGGWGVTGRRGCSGLGTSMGIVKDSPNAEPNTVPAEPKLVYQPTSMAFAVPENSSPVSMASARTTLSSESSSKKPIHNDGIDIAEAGANPIPPTEPVVHRQPTPPPPVKQARHVHNKPAGRQNNPEGYTCSDPACNMWFSTHQALGGHVAGRHKNRRLPAAAEGDGAVPRSGGSKPEKRHFCKECPAEFSTGVKLGGHMRKHWTGPPIVTKKKQRLMQPLPPPADVTAGPTLHRFADIHVAGLTLALPIKAELQSLEPAVDAAQPAPAATAAAVGTPEPSPGPRVTGRVILFGIDIGFGVQTPPAQEGSPATKDSSTSTGE